MRSVCDGGNIRSFDKIFWSEVYELLMCIVIYLSGFIKKSLSFCFYLIIEKFDLYFSIFISVKLKISDDLG